MDNKDESSRRSSNLPRSLIPHLYTAPQTARDSSTRTTLPDSEEELEQEESLGYPDHPRSPSPSVLRPITPPRRFPSFHNDTAMPSLDGPPIRNNFSSHYPTNQARSHLYPQQHQPYSYFNPITDTGESSRLLQASLAERQIEPSYFYGARPSTGAHRYQHSSIPIIDVENGGPSAIARDHANEPRDRRLQYHPRAPEPYFPHHLGRPHQHLVEDRSLEPQHHRESHSRQVPQYPVYGAYTQGVNSLQVRQFPPDFTYGGDPRTLQQQQDLSMPSPLGHGQYAGPYAGFARGWELPSSSGNGSGDYTQSIYPSLPPLPSRPEPEPDDDDEDSEYKPGPSKRILKRRRIERPQEYEAGVSRPKVKKTLIACDFCRGRKLKCDGVRPACSNCSVRDRQRVCVYQPQPRRRGPGKAPRGQRKKKSTAASNHDNFSTSGSRASNEHSGDDFGIFGAEFQQQQQLPPIVPYYPPSLPQGGLTLPSSRMSEQGPSQLPPQSQDDQDRSPARYPRRGTIKREDEDLHPPLDDHAYR